MPTALVFAVAGICTAVALAPVITPVNSVLCGAGLLVAGAAVLTVKEVRVTVDTRGLVVDYFPHLGWPRTTIRADQIRSVEAIHVEPRDHAGWGYRGSLRLFGQAALNLRRGPGLRLALTGDRIFVITLDDSDNAARAISSVIATSH